MMLASWSLTISLAIVLVVTRSPASSFTIKRGTTSAADLDTAESNHAAVTQHLRPGDARGSLPSREPDKADVDRVTETTTVLLTHQSREAVLEDTERTTELPAEDTTTAATETIPSMSSEETTTDSNTEQINTSAENHSEPITSTIDSATNAVDIETTTQTISTESLETIDVSVETTNVSSSETTPRPLRKKYKTIERKRSNATTTIETTSVDGEMTRAETARIALDKVLLNTPIPSLMKLKNDLIKAIPEHTSMHMLVELETITTQETAPTVVETLTPKIEVVSSKRAGYLDNTAGTTVPPEVTAHIDAGIDANKENFASIYDSEVADENLELPDSTKNVTSMASQSQLAEDAIKEELLMEKALNDNELLKTTARHQEFFSQSSESVPKPELGGEDALSVKPINERRKNISLYTVNANYKPLKKIDVQPAKQFVRDPDDNSWRNESISSLGIVFKPKNASKSFTEVIKNKTTELGYLLSKNEINSVPDLRVRLEKIAEVRKSKKKNKFGETIYSDYEGSSGEYPFGSKEDATSGVNTTNLVNSSTVTTAATLPPSTTPPTTLKVLNDLEVINIQKEKKYIFKNDFTTTKIGGKTKSQYNYEDTDEYADYPSIPALDLQKFVAQPKPKDSFVSSLAPLAGNSSAAGDGGWMRSMFVTNLPDRQPTIQYFPPTKKAKTTTIKMDEYDEDFKNKVNLYTYTESPKTVSFVTSAPDQIKSTKATIQTTQTAKYTPNKGNKDTFFVDSPRVSPPHAGLMPNDGHFNRGSYVIKHYGDFINEAANAADDDKNEYPYTEAPLRGVTMSDIDKFPVSREPPRALDDYDAHFTTDVLNRFVDNFNQNSDRFKVDFPVLYNNSIVHKKFDENGKVLASSSTFMKRLYEAGNLNVRPKFLSAVRGCAGCEAAALELSPAYELQYYAPEHEERAPPADQLEPHDPYRFNL